MYYYFCAGLPLLELGEKPPWTLDDFCERCGRMLSPGDYRAVCAFLADTPASAPEFVRRFQAWETQLRNAVARWRATRLSADLAGKLRDHSGFDVSLEKDVSDACARGNPLEREMALDRLRWRWAEDAARVAPFALPAVLAFALKLRLAWRWAGLDDVKGRAVIEEFAELLSKASFLKQS